jgi:hypothetical protein
MYNINDKNIDPSLLNYSVIGSSSEDEDHPLYSLISPEKNEGWCSVPFCKYPQEIILQLNNPSKLSQINITLHENKIPSKIEFYYYYPKQKNSDEEEEKFDYNNIPFIKMGYIIPNSNEKSNFKLREFKKIKINEKALYIKLTLHKNFINLENNYNQVSIISLQFFGYEFENNNPLDYKNILINEINKSKNNDYTEDNLDEICISKLKEIKSTLDLCIKKEKYDSAKIFRELYQRVKLLGQKMKNLSECKLKCIETNDYDACKKIQNDINRIKNLIGDINANYIDDENEKNNYDTKNENEDPFK